MTYWFNMFTATTWAEFQKSGARISGFRQSKTNEAAIEQVRSGDIFLCYLTGGMKRLVGALKVVERSKDQSRIWQDDVFPVRFVVKPLVLLSPEHGVPMEELEGRVAFYTGPEDRNKYKCMIRGGPKRVQNTADGDLIFSLLKKADTNPTWRAVDPKQLAYKPTYMAERRKGKATIKVQVTVPETEETVKTKKQSTVIDGEDAATTRHTEIQYRLLKLGEEMGFDLWVARNDRSRQWKSKELGAFDRMVKELPTQFNEATNRTIELIDVLWLKGNSILAAFEIECTTSVYSGLLRMSDLLALQPNLSINLFLVAPDERRNKVAQEIRRPTFSLREKPLGKVCGYISFSKLTKKLDVIQKENLAVSLKPEFLHTLAEYFTGENG